jgi:hypothetical protein
MCLVAARDYRKYGRSLERLELWIKRYIKKYATGSVTGSMSSHGSVGRNNALKLAESRLGLGKFDPTLPSLRTNHNVSLFERVCALPDQIFSL